jgi:hypothetical protein
MGTTRQEALALQGWERQATYDEPRLSEMAEVYEEIGLEVHLEPFHPDVQNHLYAQKILIERLAQC